jgi:hypothetical protein
VVVCASIEQFARSIPGGRFVVVGETNFTSDVGKKILKQCANLATSGWVVFVERSADGGSIRFGVLSFLESPTSVDLRDMVDLGLTGPEAPDAFLVLVERVDPKTILMNGARGNSLRIAFSTTRLSTEDTRAVRKFAEVCARNVAVEEFDTYLEGLLRRTLNHSHGTMLVCQGEKQVSTIKGMRDAVTSILSQHCRRRASCARRFTAPVRPTPISSPRNRRCARSSLSR